MLSIESYLCILNVDFGDAIGISLHVSQVADVTIGVFRGTVLLIVWVVMWSSRGAAISVVAEFVNVETVLTGSQACYFTRNFYWSIALKEDVKHIFNIS